MCHVKNFALLDVSISLLMIMLGILFLVKSYILGPPIAMAVDPVNVSEFEELARQALPKMYYDYYRGGAEDEYTLKESVIAFQRIMIRPRILIDVTSINLSTNVLGYPIQAPIMIAPTAMHNLAHPEGELATARAASACGSIMVLSTHSSFTIEEVASSCDAVRFFQLYIFKERELSAQLVKRAENNGYKAIVLTVDVPRFGRRESDIRNKMISPKSRNFEGQLSLDIKKDTGSNLASFANRYMDASVTWMDIKWLRSITNLPILIKGVLTAEDGIQIICIFILSSRRENTTKWVYIYIWEPKFKLLSISLLNLNFNSVTKRIYNSSLRAFIFICCSVCVFCLSKHNALFLMFAALFDIFTFKHPNSFVFYVFGWQVVQAVGGKIPVLLDGGIRRGTDIFKALALGAQAVLIGRPVVYGLAANGESGVNKVMKMLRDELELTMALAGCCSLKEITRSHVQTEQDGFRSML
ncbi:peroxisomal (S)-2-hydroxy-acid oxidase GLO4 [Amborella trichopoda]|uniref:peroxisomal (S)-2-hydroxy-acid oxidase GLO4 n=1 Tax=Amborella trichopoda TaxID=13333 RepID=UPI0009C14648|nr:peroxisomal (S)-2-hydroxy-acid oxidase GLO4 [Amborella trichopoda]|eukprot:XP_020522293.1 peroxisomal (S)-2-hydroxy-acid oxidase GLO4 [Amborella trichopoda]